MRNTKLISFSLLLLGASLLVIFSIHPNDEHNMPWSTLPFHPMDLLPLLPRHVAMSVLRSLRAVSDIFPVFMGMASAGEEAAGARLEWKGACFYKNEAWLVFHNNSGSKYGGGTLHIKFGGPLTDQEERPAEGKKNK